MLQELGIEDDYLNASKTFVRAELIPANNEWWEDPDGWNFIVDQDVVPEWFENDRDKYIVEFKAAVKAWWTEHVLVDKKIDELTGGYYLLKRCEVKKLLNDVRIAIMGNSKVGEMWENSNVGTMWENSIARHYGKGKIFISPECNLAVAVFENPKEDKNA